MKKSLTICLAALMLLTLCGCSKMFGIASMGKSGGSKPEASAQPLPAGVDDTTGAKAEPTEEPGGLPEGKKTDAIREAAKEAEENKESGSEDRVFEGTPDADELLADMENYEFIFMSGAGGWETTMCVHADGTFEGSYYDYNMGETGPGYEEYGTVYWCDFTGKLGNIREKEYYLYEADILELKYDVEPGKEEIKDGERKVYTTAYGLEDTDAIEIYAPMMSTEFLPEEYREWIYWFFYDSEEEDMVLPIEMPSYGIFNPIGGYGFYSESLLENRAVISNPVSFPGVENVRDEYDYAERTYTILDRCGEDFSVYNSCFANTDRLDIEKDEAELMRQVLSHMEMPKVDDISVYGSDMDEWMHDVVSFEGRPCLYAYWTLDSGVSYDARIITFDHFIYVYAIITDEGTEFLDGEAKHFLLTSLTAYKIYDHSDHELGKMVARDGKIDKKILALVRSKTSKDGSTYYLVADEIVFISGDDEAALKKYGLTQDDVSDDYAIGGIDGKTKDYEISDLASFYLQYNDHNPFSDLGIIDYLNDGAKECMMELYLDGDGKVVFGYEPYTP